MLEQMFVTVGAVGALAVAATGLIAPKWRSKPRSAYYTPQTVVGLIAAFLAVAGGFSSTGHPRLAFAAALVTGWIVVESVFGGWKSSSAGASFFAPQEELEVAPEPEVVAAPVEVAPAPVVRPVRSANPTPRGPQRSGKSRR